MRNNSGLLVILVIVLVAIFSLMLIQYNERTPEEKIGDSLSNSINEIGEEVRDEIDDNTDAR